MQTRGRRVAIALCVAIGAFSGAPAGSCLADTQTCVRNEALTHQTCLNWSRGVAPVEDFDFRVEYECEPGDCNMAPNVTLITGDAAPGGWRIWARLSFCPPLAVPCPSLNLGAVSVDPTSAEDFDVAITDPPRPGQDAAHDVASITLVPSGDHYASLASDSQIAGSLTGPLTVKKDSAGNGGDVVLFIEQNMSGSITAETITDLLIWGDVSGPIEAETITDLEIWGNLSAPIQAGTITSLKVNGWVRTSVNAEGVITWMDVGEEVSGNITAADITSLHIGGDLSGDVNITGDMTSGAGITVSGELATEGRIRIDGLCDAPITIAKGTGANTLIRVTDGLDVNGSITINNSEGNFDADGAILIGDLGSFPPGPVTFDDNAFILIKDNGLGAYGDLHDWLRVVGCHASGHNDLDVCVEGDEGQWVSILQKQCAFPGVFYCCGGEPCPVPE